jgi:hypothetical protein
LTSSANAAVDASKAAIAGNSLKERMIVDLLDDGLNLVDVFTSVMSSRRSRRIAA